MGDGNSDLWTRPEVDARVTALLGRIDKIEAMVDAFGTLAQRLPQLADMLGDATTFVQGEAAKRDLDPLERGAEWAALTEKALSREQVARLSRLLDKGPLLDVATTVDPADLAVLTAELPRIARLLRSPAARALLDNLDEGAMRLAGTALAATKDLTVEPTGAFGALRALGDSNVRKAVGFALGVARRFGAALP